MVVHKEAGQIFGDVIETLIGWAAEVGVTIGEFISKLLKEFGIANKIRVGVTNLIIGITNPEVGRLFVAVILLLVSIFAIWGEVTSGQLVV